MADFFSAVWANPAGMTVPFNSFIFSSEKECDRLARKAQAFFTLQNYISHIGIIKDSRHAALQQSQVLALRTDFIETTGIRSRQHCFVYCACAQDAVLRSRR